VALRSRERERTPDGAFRGGKREEKRKTRDQGGTLSRMSEKGGKEASWLLASQGGGTILWDVSASPS